MKTEDHQALKDPAPENPVIATFEKAAESEKLAGKSAPVGITSIEPERPQIEASKGETKPQ